MTNHLWQSTVFAAGVALLAWVFRNHRASIRYTLWLSASLKFLVPFTLFISLGRQAEPVVTPFPAAVAAGITHFTAPFPEVIPGGGAVERDDWMPWIFAVWGCGILAIVTMRVRTRFRVRALMRSSQLHPMKFPVEVRTSSGALEPGLVGLTRCTILLPKDLERHLTRNQLDAVLAHELCHAERRDNLTAAMHMVVEALFWFHPLVWWIGARLAETRELSCDEAVLAGGGSARDYAEAILIVCKRYVESPLACVSGITGSDLKSRIEAMLSHRVIRPLDWRTRALLAAAASTAILIPFLAGIVKAQSSKSFEVASIHLAPAAPRLPGGGALPPRMTGSTFEYTGTVYSLIIRAFSVRGCQNGDCEFVVGGPSWIQNDMYRIDAKLPEGTPQYSVTQYELGEAEDLYQMLQSLLADRFRLKMHREAKEISAYALTLGPIGHKLTPTAGRMRQYSDGTTRLDRRLGIMPIPGPDPVRRLRMTVTNFNMEEFAEALSGYLDRPVLDRTGLKDRFDFSMEFEADAVEKGLMPKIGGPGLVTGLREQLGLRLQATKGAVEVVAIESIERPSEN